MPGVIRSGVFRFSGFFSGCWSSATRPGWANRALGIDWQAQLKPHDSQNHQAFAHRVTFTDWCGPAVICTGSMRRLADQYSIRKRSVQRRPGIS